MESAAVAHPSVLEAAAVGIPHELKGEAIVVFCVLRRGESDDAALRESIGRTIVEHLGKALKPESIEVVAELPRTRSGKIMRRVVRAAYLGLDPGDVSALDNAGVLDAIRAIGSRAVSAS